MDIHNHVGEGQQVNHLIGFIRENLLLTPFLFALMIYVLGILISRKKGKKWPFYRTALWCAGIFCALASIYGPLAERGHMDFRIHMISHFLLGMFAPFLMVIARPIALLHRSLPVALARKLSKLLRSKPIRKCRDPLFAGCLNVGGLWLLYTSNLYSMMVHHFFMHFIINIHIFLAGFLFTEVLISFEKLPNKPPFLYRVIVFVLASAGHSILAKHIYSHPPDNVSAEQAKAGGMIMYYSGDIIDIMITIILCYQWFKGSKSSSFQSILDKKTVGKCKGI